MLLGVNELTRLLRMPDSAIISWLAARGQWRGIRGDMRQPRRRKDAVPTALAGSGESGEWRRTSSRGMTPTFGPMPSTTACPNSSPKILNMAADTAPSAREIHSSPPLSRKLGNVKARQSIQSLFSAPQQRRLRKNILAWYDLHHRDLPWRASRDPYRVWLSEIMLQQTRVAAVIEHYWEFLRCFPTVEKLAAAREASVLAAWSGLGYYRRARMMHAAAKVIVRECAGKFPATEEGLRTLPGIGRYTAAAISSIAFDVPVAVVDGNVERVLQRVEGKRLAGEELWTAANRLLDAKRPGDFNQAMMELGAVVCTPRAPACLTCPVVELCATRGELAPIRKAARQQRREIHYALDFRDGDVFLVRRAQDASLMPGMWELPEMAREWGDGPAFTLRHSITTTDYTVRVWRDATSSREFGKWIPIERLDKVALTGLARKILQKAGML
jgi:A/G-specific adenine glycosylase